jgi:hypothetical protein
MTYELNPAQEREAAAEAARAAAAERELEREAALIERWHVAGLKGEGPLTREQAAAEAAYARYLEEEEREEEARRRAGGRRICPACGSRSLASSTVATYGGGLPGSEYSELLTCERPACGYRSL